MPSPESFPLLNYGYFVLRALWKQLGLHRLLLSIQDSKLRIKFDLNAVASFMVFSKVLDPHSVRFSFYDHDLFIADPLKNIRLQNCYDTLGFLKQYQERIFKTVNRKLDEEYGKERSLLIFYDVTNAYFESPLTDEEWQYQQKDYNERLEELLKQAKNSTHFDTIRPLNFDMKRSRNFDTMRPFNFEVIRPPNFDMYFYHSLTFSHLDSSHDCIAAMLPFYFMSFLCHKEKHFILPSSVQSAQII